MQRKKLFTLLLVICLLLTGCNPLAPNTKKAEKSVNFIDSSKRSVELPAEITRVAASGLMAQIVLFAICPDLLVGLADEWAPEAGQFIDTKYEQLPVLGQFYGVNTLDPEAVAAADPQVIIDIGESKKTIVEDMDGIQEQIGIPTIHIEATTKTMAQAYRTLGKLLGREERAEKLAVFCEETLSTIHGILADQPKTSLLYCLGDSGLNVIANTSFHAEVIDLVGNNLAVVASPSFKGSGNEVDLEQLLLWDPEVILFAPGSIYSSVGQDAAWQQLQAIASGHYYEVPHGPYNWLGDPPSANLFMGMLWLTDLLYPEATNYDLYEKAAEYYRLFYGCDLTPGQFAALTQFAK
ncbi:MAG: ABC transporter substrate-binding protein [Negativicutes bacterium]|nr:ABC transporter substrate-binding protein [Negativicutes bacterium]